MGGPRSSLRAEEELLDAVGEGIEAELGYAVDVLGRAEDVQGEQAQPSAPAEVHDGEIGDDYERVTMARGHS